MWPVIGIGPFFLGMLDLRTIPEISSVLEVYEGWIYAYLSLTTLAAILIWHELFLTYFDFNGSHSHRSSSISIAVIIGAIIVALLTRPQLLSISCCGLNLPLSLYFGSLISLTIATGTVTALAQLNSHTICALGRSPNELFEFTKRGYIPIFRKLAYTG